MGSKKRALKKKPKKKKLKVVSTANTILVPIRIPKLQLKKLKGQAKRYAKGNLSAWLRHTGLRYRPKRGEIVETIPRPIGKSNKKKR